MGRWKVHAMEDSGGALIDEPSQSRRALNTPVCTRAISLQLSLTRFLSKLEYTPVYTRVISLQFILILFLSKLGFIPVYTLAISLQLTLIYLLFNLG